MAIALLPVSTFLGFFTIPVVVPALIWLVVLGVRLMRPNTTVRTTLRVTHCLLAPLEALLVVYGIHCLQAARRSAEFGGGLLGASGLIPIVIGVLAGSLSVASLCVAFSGEVPRPTEAGQSFGCDSGAPLG
ncbi:hypothetical protein EVJ50_01945 [Synechococcus sp. RSCCF101]|uniref:hypothetical protein n=1 Tax=Synechococcus sp. RSCCF101 TaxID=2511069 RepID=UPI0012A2F4A8|nr:hypothetical protein [Synechococcus sp. RSCCF101]QEY31194.1 hypothetical protein EVJ50_01945 [Synechococcus sp. RSCCF101]